MPTDEIDSLVVVGERRVRRQVIATERESRPVAPVTKHSRRTASIVVKCGDVVQRKPVAE